MVFVTLTEISEIGDLSHFYINHSNLAHRGKSRRKDQIQLTINRLLHSGIPDVYFLLNIERVLFF